MKRLGAIPDGETGFDRVLAFSIPQRDARGRVEPLPALSRGCRCTAERYEQLLGRFTEEDRQDMRGEDGLIAIDCAFCSKIFRIAA